MHLPSTVTQVASGAGVQQLLPVSAASRTSFASDMVEMLRFEAKRRVCWSDAALTRLDAKPHRKNVSSASVLPPASSE